MEKATVTIEQDGKKAIANVTCDGDKVVTEIEFYPPVEGESAELYTWLTSKFIDILRS